MYSSQLSVTQTYLLANKAQAKLQKEAAKQDLNLRLLLCHAHLLDNIINHLSSKQPSRGPQYYDDVEESESVITREIDSDEEEEDDDDEDCYIDYYDTEKFNKHNSAVSSNNSHDSVIIYDIEGVSEDDSMSQAPTTTTTEFQISDDEEEDDDDEDEEDDEDDEDDEDEEDEDVLSDVSSDFSNSISNDEEDDDIYDFNYVTAKPICRADNKKIRLVKNQYSNDNDINSDDEIDITELSISSNSYVYSSLPNSNSTITKDNTPKTFCNSSKNIKSNNDSIVSSTELSTSC